MEEKKQKLLEDMHQTKGARFAAHHRLVETNQVTNYTVSFSSFMLLCISIFTVMYQGVAADWYLKYLTFISVSLSVLIIILSLQEGGKNNLLRAEMMHNCAREVLAVHRELSLDQSAVVNLESYRDRYQRIIDRYPYNHDKLDRQTYLFDSYENKKRKIDSTDEAQITLSKTNAPKDPKFERLWSIYGMNCIYMLIPVVLVIAPLLGDSAWSSSSEQHDAKIVETPS